LTVRIVDARVAAVAAPYPQPLWPGPHPIATATAVIVHLEERDGCVGLGYVPTFGFGTQAVRSLIADDLAPRLRDVDWESGSDAARALVASAALAGRLAGAAKLAISTLECAAVSAQSRSRSASVLRRTSDGSAPCAT
jgi:L-alanine-DL-glutamate epimerase-like enolase superfamily enzyme